MKRNLYICVGIIMIVSCAGCRNGLMHSSEEKAKAGQVMKYYNTSLVFLKNMVKERNVNSVLSYMENWADIPMFSFIISPVMSKRDSVEVMQPGECFSEEVRINLIENYRQLFRSKILFYANFSKYLSLLKEKNVDGMPDLLNDNYKLSLEMSECKQNLYDILGTAASGARKVLLAGNPQKELIIAMEEMKLTMLSITDLYARKHAKDKTRLDQKIAELKNQLNAAEKLPLGRKNDKNAKKMKDFLSKAEHFMTVMQNIRKKDTFSEEDYEKIYDCEMSLL